MQVDYRTGSIGKVDSLALGYQPALVVDYIDELYGAKGFLVIDLLVDGIAGGGFRMKSGLTKEEMMKLARTMTKKFTLIEPRIGGAKCGVDFDPARPEKVLVMQRFFEFLRPFLFNCYVTGADLNTNESEIVACTKSIGLPAPQYALAKKLGKTELRLRRFYEGINLLVSQNSNLCLNSAATGYGICAAASRAMIERGMEGCSAAIQGFGNVGGSVASFLVARGAKVLAVSDRFGTVYCKDGLDIEYLLARRDERTKAVFPVLTGDRQCPPNYELIPDPEAIYGLAGDLFIPVADSGIITPENYRQIAAKYIVCGANDPFAPAGLEQELFDDGKVVIPDFIANVGTAALYHALLSDDGPVTVDCLLQRIENQISRATEAALTKSQSENISPRLAAELIAIDKIESYPDQYVTTLSTRRSLSVESTAAS